MPKVFIVILNWNNWPETIKCLDSLKNNDYPVQEVVIVDNGSEKKISPDNLPLAVKIIYNQKNLGFAGGNNVGIRYALKKGADYVLLLNNDTRVSSDFLTKLMEAGEKDKFFGFLGPKIYFEDEPRKIWFAGGKISWLYHKGEMRGYGEEDKGQYDFPRFQVVDYITGCCLLVKKEVIEKIGLIPEEYFLYYEDTAWSLKARKNGFKCVFVPGAWIRHKGSASSQEGSPSYIYYHTRNGLMMARQFMPWYLKPILYGEMSWRIVKQIIKLIFFPSKRQWAKYILLGIRDFCFNKTGPLKV